MAAKDGKDQPIFGRHFCGLVILTTSTGVDLLAEVRNGKLFRNVAVFLIPREEFNPILEKYVTIVKPRKMRANGRTA
jgi:hypothetical protein